MEDQLVTSSLCAHRTAQTQNKRTQTSMPQVGVFEQSKTVHALDRTETMIGWAFQIDLRNKIMVFLKMALLVLIKFQ
jgi:hypothetical protein